MRLLDYVARLSRPALIVFGLVQVAVIGFLDYFTGGEANLSILYLVPIALLAWFGGRTYGVVFAGIGTLVWLLADLATAHYSVVLVRYWNVVVRLGYFVIISLTLSRLRISFEREKSFARLDSTTGIANGRAFAELAEAEIERARRYHQPLSIAYLDLDNFKTINDQFGHGTGDRVLSTVGQTIRKSARVTDVVARLGGDEFAVLMPETGAEAARTFLTRMQGELSELMQSNGWPVTFSIGVATFTSAPENVEKLIERADALMYSVKNTGKNRIEEKTFAG